MWYNKNNNNVLKQKLYFGKFGKGNDMLNESIKKLVTYGMETGLVPECERNYTINLMLDLFHQDDYEEALLRTASVTAIYLIPRL